MLEAATDYRVYGGPISLFTRKLECALRFYGAPHSLVRKEVLGEDEVAARAGTRQIPVLETPEGWMIADTTPLLDLLDGRFPARRLFPEGPLGVMVHVIEEILDEWLARTMVHYRWHYPENTRHVVAILLGRDVTIEEAQEHPLAQWGPRSCRATGTESDHQQREVEREYLAVLDALETQLAQTPFALGDRPTAVDAILLGGLRAHTNADPIPDLSSFARVLAWDAERADTWNGGGEWVSFPSGNPFADHVLALGAECYSPFVLGNARALEAGEKAFVITTYGEEVSYLTRPYPERSRKMVQARIRDRLDAAERKQVVEWLEGRRLAECFAP
jgi:glutathione S-transferase